MRPASAAAWALPGHREPDVDPLAEVLLRIGAVGQPVPCQDEGQHGSASLPGGGPRQAIASGAEDAAVPV